MRDAAGETAGESDADTRTPGALGSAAIGEGTEQILGHAQKILRVAIFLRMP